MAGFVKTRKRSREDELPCDSTPLSKRINNLHLNYDEGNSSSSSNCSLPSAANSNNNDNNNILPVFAAVGVNGTTAPTVDGHNPNPDGTPGPVYGYNPELSVEQNPYYYAKNKMLYDLHVERVKRNAQ